MQNIVVRLQYLHKKKLDDNEEMLRQIKSHYFISAEGAYSSLIFNTYRKHQENLHYNPNNKNNYKVLIAGRMMSDKNTKPVIWRVEFLLHYVLISHRKASCIDVHAD